MKGLKRMASFAGLLLSTSLAAQADTATYAFTSVTGIQYGISSITGILANTNTLTTVTIATAFPDQCWSLLLTTLSTPGGYTFTIVTDTETNPFPLTTITSCSFNRGN